ncbi:MAG: DUF4783 domain-containing protein [Bacteroidota bacterium]
MNMRKTITLVLGLLLGLAAVYYFTTNGNLEVDKPPTTDQGTTIPPSIPDSYGQSDEVVNSFKKGNADQLIPFLAEEVELILLEEEDILPSEEAKVQLNRFFTNQQTTGFDVKHRGQSGGGANSYMIGNLRTSKNTYRTYITFNNEKIVEIRIEEE